MHWSLEETNYARDSRVIAGQSTRWFSSLDRKAMKATAVIEREDDDEAIYEETLEVPFEWQVCPACQGKGSHVNPSVDCCGLSADDFREDPEFAEDYCSGAYDITCNECGGERLVPVMCETSANEEQKKAITSIRDWHSERLRNEAESRAEMIAERRMGA